MCKCYNDKVASSRMCKRESGENPEQSRYCKRSPGNYVTDASWEGAEGDEAKPGDLPVTKLGAYGR